MKSNFNSKLKELIKIANELDIFVSSTDMNQILSDDEIDIIMEDEIINNHFMAGFTYNLKVLYLRFLSVIHQITKIENKKKEVKFFIFRVGKSLNIKKEDIILAINSPLNDTDKIREILKILDYNGVINICVDMLLAGIQYDYTEKDVLKFYSKWLSILTKREDDVNTIFDIIESIINRNISMLISTDTKINISDYIGYITDKNITIKDKYVLSNSDINILKNLDLYKGKFTNMVINKNIKLPEIYFINCNIYGVKTLKELSGYTGKLNFIKCDFISKTSILLELFSNTEYYPLDISEGCLKDCNFNGFIDVNGLVKMRKGCIQNTTFTNCGTNSETKLISIENGYLKDNRFISCKGKFENLDNEIEYENSLLL